LSVLTGKEQYESSMIVIEYNVLENIWKITIFLFLKICLVKKKFVRLDLNVVLKLIGLLGPGEDQE
jgi:hypothetical protein